MIKKANIGILSLGCPRNLVDSEEVLGRLSLKGYRIVDMDNADIGIVNTCAFIEEAKSESIDAILGLVELKKSGRLKKIIVHGCLSERYKYELRKEIPEIDAFVGKLSLNHSLKRFPITPSHFVYLKVCEGCVNNCSFCVIPKIKGKFASLETGLVLKKVEEFNKDKVSEINIVGQDITGYGLDIYGKLKLADIVKKVCDTAKNTGWVRLLYLNPERINDELLELIRDTPKICKYIDLPVQHINNRILKLMNRNSSRQGLIRLIKKIRKIIPGVGLRTSIIAGFPSETASEFKELLEFVKDTGFERLGAFMYSREEGTPAYNIKGQVSKKIKLERFNQIMSLQQNISKEINKGFLGRRMTVLIDEKQGSQYLGRTQYDAPEVDGVVYVNSKEKLSPGEFIQVKITDTLEYDLVGEKI